MNKELKDKWLEALRSGKYKKRIGSLRASDENGDFFCPFGVLLDIFDKKRWRAYTWNTTTGLKVYEYDGDYMAVSKNVMVEMKLTEGDVVNFVRICALSDMNGASLSQVADWIEQNIKTQ